MKKHFKKIITITYLIIFLFSLFVPFDQITAQQADLTISSDKTSLKVGTETVLIKAVTSAGNANKIVFTSSLNGGVFVPADASCISNKGETMWGTAYITWSCTVEFKSSNEGTSKIKASTYYSVNNLKLESNEITISVIKPPPVIIKPEAPKINTNTTYTPLAPLPGLPEGIPFNTQIDKVTNPCPFGNYLNIVIKLIIGIAAVLAMVMITMGGIQYVTSELVSGKEAGKETITHAVLGLLIALGAFLILNTINPQLLSVCLNNIKPAEIVISLGGESTQPFMSIASTPTGKAALKDTFGIPCDGVGGKSAVESIGRKFINQTEYSKEKRNTYTSSTIYVDCSSFAAQVYVCAGLPSPGNRSTDIFSGGNTTKIDGATFDYTTLHTGDLIGWKPGENNETDGHVMIYVEQGKILDTQNTNDPTQVRTLSDALKKRIKYIKWP